MSATMIAGTVIACLAFVLRLLEWFGVRPQSIRQRLPRRTAALALAVLASYDVFLASTLLTARRPSDIMWWSVLTLCVWTVFTLLRAMTSNKAALIACNLASTLAVLTLVIVSWRLSGGWLFPLALSIMTAIWLITLLVESAVAIRRGYGAESERNG